ncbi:tetratricopeptide repeat protein [Anderseniella sp. Alg231-50]|uniref:tetratricopeptide repeat protein n=1 Tax=Anderseniella sp. Alg231-50 TaxID=1922226 RepID=UPI00307C7446
MTSAIIASLMAIPLTVATGAADRAQPPYLLQSTTQQDNPVDISQRFKRAQKGDAASQLVVGMKYLELHNFVQALYWFEKSAAQGNVRAQIYLGDAYANGKGVSVDFVKAHIWLSLAAANGGYEAKFRFEYLLSKMTPEQIAEAQRATPARKPALE